MDEFEKVNETLENEETKTESEVVELSEETEPVVEAEETASEETAAESTEETDTAEEAETESSEPTDAAEETAGTDSFSETISESDYTVEDVPAAEPKKPAVIQRTIIISACILLAALLAFGVFVLVKNITTPSLDGVWVMTKVYTKGNAKNAQKTKTSGKEAVYYDFKSDGKFVYTSGTVKQTLMWSYVDAKNKKTDEKTNKITVYAKGGEANGNNYGVKLEGGLFAEKKLKLEVSTNMGTGMTATQIMEFKSYDGSQAPEYKMSVDKNFKPVDDLLGTWNDKTTKQKITFNKDGSYVLNVGGNLEQSGNYKVDTKKNTVTLSYVGNGTESNTGALPYKIKDGKLTLATYTFEKVK
ncbi:MAG: hypothetical protein IJ932_06385 [Ruminococcus sp.]|nr:hypothetical protein [Ruminococcus sp.]